MFISYKGRSIDLDLPVKVYRNLNNHVSEKYSVQQKGLVVGHTNELCLLNVQYKVSEAGRTRVLKNKRKNVHAYIVGYIDNLMDPNTRENIEKSGNSISYNPYKMSQFHDENGPIYKSKWCLITKKLGVLVGV